MEILRLGIKSTLLFLLSFLFDLQSIACTVFKIQTLEGLYVGSNEDWKKINTGVRVWFTPHYGNRYAVSYFGFGAHSGWAQSALNECGLFYDSAECPPSKIGYSADKQTFVGDMFRKVMEECSDLDEAIILINKYNWTVKKSIIKTHFLIVDKKGESAVFEWIKGDLKIIRGEKSFQAMTNFSLSLNDSVPSCERYSKCQAANSKNTLNNIQDIDDLLTEVQQKGSVSTVISKIYNLKNGVLQLKYSMQNDSLFEIDLFNGFRDSTYYIDLPPINRSRFSAQSQTCSDDDTVLFDKNWNPIKTQKRIKYFRIKETEQIGDTLYYFVKDYYKNGMILKTGYYRSESDIVLGYVNNTAVNYYPNGRKKAEGLYVNNRKNGLWTYWKPNGEIKRKIFFFDDVVIRITDE